MIYDNHSKENEQNVALKKDKRKKASNFGIADKSSKGVESASLQLMADKSIERKQEKLTNSYKNNSSDGTIQRVKRLDNGGKIIEPEDTQKKRDFILKHIAVLESKGLQDKADILREKLKESPELAQDEVLFESVGNPQQRGTVYALFASSANAPYYVFPTNYGAETDEVDASLANGTYQFAITTNHPNEVLVSHDLGHDGIAQSKNVYYAGTVTFQDGALMRWNNDTGHYKTIEEYAPQVLRAPTDDLASGILPLNKFVLYEP